MKRRIIIITNPGEAGDEHYCEGVYRDRDNYRNYFMAPYGGYFSETEIKVHDKPYLKTVKQELEDLKADEIEFSVMIFCGHGFYSTQSQSNILCLNKTERIDSLDLKDNYRKRIIILDSCREPHDEYLFEDQTRAFADLLKAGKWRLNSEDCKKYFNSKVSTCSDQVVVLYGCSIGEVCNDDSQLGGLYSSSFLKTAKEWVDSKLETIDLSKSYGTYSTSECHQGATAKVIKRSAAKQNPVIEKPRTTDILPISVVA